MQKSEVGLCLECLQHPGMQVSDSKQDAAGFFFGEIKRKKDIHVLIFGAYLMKPEAPGLIPH